MTSNKRLLPALAQRAHKVGLEVRWRLRPLGAGARRAAQGLLPLLRPVERGLAAIAPAVVGALWLAVSAPLSLLVAGVGAIESASARTADFAGTLSAGAAHRASAVVTPVRAVAFACAAAAVALGVAQFTDYSGVAVGAPGYEGEVGTVARAPQTALETAGSAHFYLLLPLAAAALVLTRLTARGRWRLGRAIAAVGLAGIVVTLAVDLPQGLDAGRAGDAYLGTDARLIEGFWAQLAASVALVGLGPLLGAYVRRAAGGAPAGGRSRARRRLAFPVARSSAAVPGAEART
jgi:hypothetical protein